jgi:hypothetical protein
MKLTAYLSQSRHGIFYFRWPLPPRPGRSKRRDTLRLSLSTRCPKRAGEMARHLSSYGLALTGNLEGKDMRHEEIREAIRAYHQTLLDKQIAWAREKGRPGETYVAHLNEHIEATAEQTEHYWDLLDSETGGLNYLHKFCAEAGLPSSLVESKAALLRGEIKSARRSAQATPGTLE